MLRLPRQGLNRQITRLNAIANGPGAVLVSNNVAKINLVFKDGFKPGKRFWRQTLPQVQFHNPSLPISVTKFPKDEDSSKLSELIVEFKDGQQKKAFIGDKPFESIIDDLIKLTDAKPVPQEDIPILKRREDDLHA